MLIKKDDYAWMSSEAIIEQFTTTELREFYNELSTVRSADAPAHMQRSEVLEQFVFNDTPRYQYFMDVLNHIDDLVRAEILFRFKEDKF